MNPKVKIVVGANYGDEGKGLATHYFSKEAWIDGPVLNVLYNGGPQRGHTVEFKDGVRHIFHHFGSGFFDGASTYYDEDFMVNPIIYVREKEELKGIVNRNFDEYYPKNSFHTAFINHNCRVITPWDCMVNQIVEKSRGENRHGSCGSGIWETQKRYEDGVYALKYIDLVDSWHTFGYRLLTKYFEAMRDDYMIKRLKQYGIDEVPEEYREAFYSDKLIENYIFDLGFMDSTCTLAEFGHLAKVFDTIIFEGGQGLALDEGNKEALPHVTASKTGSLVPVQRVDDISGDVEICYVTRTYFTRHGAGPFPTECNKDDICKGMHDATNEPNDWQGTLRYGKFDFKEFYGRISNDFAKAREITPRVRGSLMLTHCNEGETEIPIAHEIENMVYMSETPYAEDIHHRNIVKWRQWNQIQ